MIEDQLQKDLSVAIKSKDAAAIGAIRSIKTAIQNEKTSGAYHELSDDDVVKIIQKQIKQRDESILIYSQAGRDDLAEDERAEKEFLERYVPRTLSDEETLRAVIDIISELGAVGMKDMGKVMKALNTKYPNQVDGKAASGYVRTKLQS